MYSAIDPLNSHAWIPTTEKKVPTELKITGA